MTNIHSRAVTPEGIDVGPYAAARGAAERGVMARAVPVSPTRVFAPHPSDPAVDGQGAAALPNGLLAQELLVQREARLAYGANLRALEAQSEMLGTLLEAIY